ncbi:MAG: CpsD/CapB family tyrosine-protein kinase [Clostridia bacterium]|nr:CpsD/CapB family tyrosine-protein kinase [Clostridia bacterium]
MKDELIVHRDPKSPISETFRTLRTNLQFINSKDNLQTVLITSTLPREGKSFVSANLAVAFAQVREKNIINRC